MAGIAEKEMASVEDMDPFGIDDTEPESVEDDDLPGFIEGWPIKAWCNSTMFTAGDASTLIIPSPNSVYQCLS